MRHKLRHRLAAMLRRMRHLPPLPPRLRIYFTDDAGDWFVDDAGDWMEGYDI
jgi:hypothetical protein